MESKRGVRKNVRNSSDRHLHAGGKDFAAHLWDSVKSAGVLLGRAWSWLKGQLGIADTDDGQEGLLGWVKRKLGEAWDWIKAKLDPIIGPIKAFAGKVAAILPIC